MANWRVGQGRYKTKEELAVVEQKVKQKNDEKTILQEKILQLQSDLERFGRENLNLKKSGENVVAFPDAK